MMNSNNFFFVCLFFLFNFNNFWKVLWEVLLIKSCELQMTTLRMKYMNRQGTSCFRARTWATPDFSISQWGEGVHLARGQRHTQAAHTAGCDLEQTESLSSLRQEWVLLPRAVLCGQMPFRAHCWLFPSALLLLPGPRMWPRPRQWLAGVGRGSHWKPHLCGLGMWWLWLACSPPEGEVVGSGDFALFTVGSVWHGADTQFPTFSCVRSSVYLSRGTSGTVKSLRFGSVSIITALH